MATIEAKLGQDFTVVATNSFATDGESSPEFFTKSGWLSGYALGCGYIESAEGVTLGAEHGVYVVKGDGDWKVFGRMNEARKYFVKEVKARLRKDMAALELVEG